MHERPRQRNLRPLALREALRPPVGEVADFEQLDDARYPIVDLGAIDAAKARVIRDVLASGQVRV